MVRQTGRSACFGVLQRAQSLSHKMALSLQETNNQETLTPLYGRWMDDLLGAPIPRETKATCDDCCMCAKPGETAGHDFFDPTIKCCSIVPELSNFLVGGILSETTDDADSLVGRDSILRRITEGIAVTPLGLGQSQLFKLIYENQDAFGRSRSLRCPHYVESNGRCGIRRHRGAVCIVWYCKHTRGAVGLAFWRHALEHLLDIVERNLAAWCVTQLDIGIDALNELFGATTDARPTLLTAHELDSRPDPDRQPRLWGKWFGREQDFFVECARLVEPLSWNRVVEICGSQARIQADLTRHAYEQLVSEEIPPALKVGSVQLIRITNGVSRVRTYSELDPLDVPAAVMEILGYFDGRPTEEALKALAADKSLQLAPDLIRKLCDFQVLVPAGPAQSP